MFLPLVCGDSLWKRALLLVGFWVCAVGQAQAVTIPQREGRLVDTAQVFSAYEKAGLERDLLHFRKETGCVLFVWVLPSLEGEPIAEAASRAFVTWKVGEPGKENGLLLVMSLQDQAVRLETGKWPARVLHEMEIETLVRTHLAPRLQEHQWAKGVEATAFALRDALLSYGSGQPMALGLQITMYLFVIAGIGSTLLLIFSVFLGFHNRAVSKRIFFFSDPLAWLGIWGTKRYDWNSYRYGERPSERKVFPPVGAAPVPQNTESSPAGKEAVSEESPKADTSPKEPSSLEHDETI